MMNVLEREMNGVNCNISEWLIFNIYFILHS